MSRVLFAILAILLATEARAEDPAPYSGTEITDTGQPFGAYVEKLVTAVRSNGMGVVAQACASCGAKSIGVDIPGNRVVMVFNARFAVRMLEASVAAGVEAPLRLYVVELADGTARLSYRLPSHLFAPYAAPALDEMARELDAIVGHIVAEASL